MYNSDLFTKVFSKEIKDQNEIKENNREYLKDIYDNEFNFLANSIKENKF